MIIRGEVWLCVVVCWGSGVWWVGGREGGATSQTPPGHEGRVEVIPVMEQAGSGCLRCWACGTLGWGENWAECRLELCQGWVRRGAVASGWGEEGFKSCHVKQEQTVAVPDWMEEVGFRYD